MASTRMRTIKALVLASGAVSAATIAFSLPEAAADHVELDRVRKKIADPKAVVPSREFQKSLMMGSSLTNPLDVLVIGGGATGCGVALDAVARGLRVGLVEKDDFSSGTSSRSTKLIHGGITFGGLLSKK